LIEYFEANLTAFALFSQYKGRYLPEGWITLPIITQPSQSFKSSRVYLPLPILNILVPQVGQIPEVAGLPFFIVMDLGLFPLLSALYTICNHAAPPFEYERYTILCLLSIGLQPIFRNI
jgi:hypothetical protein